MNEDINEETITRKYTWFAGYGFCRQMLEEILNEELRKVKTLEGNPSEWIRGIIDGLLDYASENTQLDYEQWLKEKQDLDDLESETNEQNSNRRI